ncbi:MBL fold metallo-hydrolase RNA specificity domain-containing protein [Oceanicella actignis]|uniref:MBL fold metallo-hydrolase RNA specificity domain-containing protein n=1 Tax=Oceanicella actignis TaxID=1189325 RepID=UPI0011E716FD|nr:MBL fold metallo-hydrolase [Oceanicella actignis]TYO90659.1 metallo-beta-lactamase family protein [Oceanicella actignis]
MKIEATFHGGAGTVTGSCTLIRAGDVRFLIDCGMFQGNRTVRELNFQEFPFDPRAIDFVLLTHAHIDHSGLLPKLTRMGFKGPIHATQPTLDLLEFLLPDSGKIQEGDVERLNRRRRRHGEPPVAPAYTAADAEECLRHGAPQPLETWFEPAPGVRARLWNAGHILGSASIELAIEVGGPRPLRMIFSGDLGPDEKIFHEPPEAPEGYDYVVCESTYGDREREDVTTEQRREQLRDEINAALARGGNLIIPSFAVERSQELLHDIGVLLSQGQIRRVPVFLDSPLASRVTKVFMKHARELEDIDLDPSQLFRNPNFRIVESVEDSMAINRLRGGAIIISASGMCEAGRIKHHLRNNLWRDDCTVLFVGYQAPGTLGRLILDGADIVRIHGHDVKVKARIRSIEGYSAHADQKELLAWLRARLPVRAAVFLNHGEDDARRALAALLAAQGVPEKKILLPGLDERFALSAGRAPLRQPASRRAAPEQLTQDWMNAKVALCHRMDRALEAIPDPRRRLEVLARLQAELERALRDARAPEKDG